MIRAFLMAIGIFLLILGAQTLIVDRWLISTSGGPVNQAVSKYYNNNQNFNGQTPFRSASFSNGPNNLNGFNQTAQRPAKRQRIFKTREWMPWSLLAAGTIVVLYAYSLRSGE